MRLAGGKARPYLVPGPGVVEAGLWMSGGTPVAEFQRDWDPNTDLNLMREVSVDSRMLRDQCLLAPETVLEVGVIWTSSATRLRGSGSRIAFELSSDSTEVILEVKVPGREAGGSLALETVLSFREAPVGHRELAPSSNGDVLWVDRKSIQLEGGQARFPVSVVDFEGLNGIPTEAFWVLSWPGNDFDEPFAASIRVLINSRHSDVVEAVHGSDHEAFSLAIRRHLQLDIARSLIQLALENEEFIERGGDYEDGTLGKGISGLIDQCFGASGDPVSVKRLLATQPGEFETILQSRVMSVVQA